MKDPVNTSIEAFVKSKCLITSREEDMIRAIDLFSAYLMWAEPRGKPVPNSITFSRRLARLNEAGISGPGGIVRRFWRSGSPVRLFGIKLK